MLANLYAHLLHRIEESPAGRLFLHMYSFYVFWWDSTRKLISRPLYPAVIIEQMEFIGIRSLSLVLLTSTFTGLVLAFQTGFSL